MFYTYILKSKKDGKMYTGSTKNLRLRFEQHKKGDVESTKYRRPLELIYYEACVVEDDARRREKVLKSYRGKMLLRNRLKSYFTGSSAISTVAKRTHNLSIRVGIFLFISFIFFAGPNIHKAYAIAISGTTNLGDLTDVIKIAVDGTLDSASGSITSSTWTITPATTPTTGQIVVVFVNGQADSGESTAVAKYDGTGDMTGIVLNSNVLSIGSVDDQSLTVANLDLYDCNADEDVMYAGAATSLAVQGCTNSYTDETIQIESGDTLTIDSDETLTSDNLTITGTLTQTTTGVITLTGNLSTSGTFNGGSGAITIIDFSQTAGTFTSTSGTLTLGNGSSGDFTQSGGSFVHNSGTIVTRSNNDDATWNVPTSITLYNLDVNAVADGRQIIITSGDTLVVAGTLTLTDGDLMTGTVEAQGGVTVQSGWDTGNATISFLVAGDQAITNNSGVNSQVPQFNINKSSGTVSISGGDLNIGGLTLASSGTGAFTSTSGILTVGKTNGTTGHWTHTGGGTFNHNNGTVVAAPNNATWNVATSETFYNFTVNAWGGGPTVTIASGDTLVVTSTFTHTNGAISTGTIEAQAGVTIGAGADNSTGTLSFLVAGDQVITNTGGGSTGKLNINKASGTVSISGGNLTISGFTLASSGTGAFTSTSGTLTVDDGAWTHTGGGTFNHNNGTVTLSDNDGSVTWDVATSETFYNFIMNKTSPNQTLTISSGDTLVVTNTFTHTDGLISTGTVEAQGNVTIGTSADGGTGLLKFSGSAAQTYTDNGGNEMDGDITINKTSPSDTVTFASNADWNATNQDLTITRGTLSQGASYNLLTGIITVATNGTWTNTGTGDVTLGGNVTNSGRITFNGGGSGCGTDSIAIASSNAANNRTWTTNTGAQTTLIDIAASDQAGTLTVYSSTNTSDNSWTFSDVCIEISGEQARKIRLTSVRLRNVRLR